MRTCRRTSLLMRIAVVGALGAVTGCDEKTTSEPTPALSVACAANPASGQAPLSVGFTVNVSGAQGAFSVAINYGDGTTGSSVASPHTYATAGSYTAAFSVSTATQSALCSTVVRVDAAPAPSPTPTPTNQAPSAVFRTTPEPGTNGTFRGGVPFAIDFNMCRSSDPEGDRLNFRMDFEGDGIWNVDGTTGGDCRREYTYTRVGTYTPRICVTDLLSSLQPAHPYQCQGWAVVLK
jgi:hypothetical protein